jgi:hypothetical protein
MCATETLHSCAHMALQQEVDGLPDQLGPTGMLGICQSIQRGQLALPQM